jgi:hypothetical protein
MTEKLVHHCGAHIHDAFRCVGLILHRATRKAAREIPAPPNAHARFGTDTRANLQGGFVMRENRNTVSIRVAGVSASLRRLAVTAAGVMAAALLMLAPAQRAQALSLASPGAVPLSAKYVSDGLIEVRGGHGGGGHGGGFHGGGGGGFHGGGGGGFHGGGGRAFHGGGFRGFHGGIHRGGFVGRPHVWAGHRVHWRGRHFVRPRFYGGYYPYSYGPRCRVILTYYGPRRICRYRPWVHRHYRWHRRYW